jgi:DNA-binding transcriptional MocR family regulator
MDPFPFGSDEPSPDLLPLEELADCAATALARDGKVILSYGSGAGYTPLRELIAQWFETDPSRVVLTNGWLQGLTFLAGELVRGRSAAVEYPSDPRTIAALLGSGGSLIYISSDRDGMITTEIEQQLIQYVRPALICLSPTFGSPTGHTMSLARRRHMLEVLGNYNRLGVEQLHLVEDDSFALTRFEGERLPALYDLSGGTTLYSSSFSASIAPGLRVGWLILPSDLAARVSGRANATYITPALLGQATAYEFIARGTLEPHLARVREALRTRRDAMLAALAEHLPEASWSHPEGGYFVWLELPELLDGRAVVTRADGVTAVSGTEFGVTSAYLRLSYAAVEAADIPEGIARLGQAAREELAGQAA